MTRTRTFVALLVALAAGVAAAQESPERAPGEAFVAARSEWDAGRYEEARDLLKKVVEAEPEHPHAWNELGRTHLALRDFEAARLALERQVEVDPFHAFAYNNLGQAHMALGQPAAAEAAFLKQIEVSPLDQVAHKSLGLIMADQGRVEESVTWLERAVALARDDRDARLQLGRVYLRAQRIEGAVGLFDELVESGTLTPPQMSGIAYWLADAGADLPRARRYIERLIAAVHGAIGGSTITQMQASNLAPQHAAVYMWHTRGLVALKEGDLPQAELWLEATFAWSNNHAVALHLGMLREKQGRPADAVRAYRRAAHGPAPRTPTLIAARAEAAKALERLEQAGHTADGDPDAVDLRSHQSILTVPEVTATSGEVIVSVGTDAKIDDVLVVGESGGHARLVDALKGREVPGTALARHRQVRLFRKAAFTCTADAVCTLVWHRVP